MKNKILITGASGFIGTNLLEYFKNLEFEVLNLDILPPRNKKHFSSWEKTDILDCKDITRKMNGFNPDYIVHLAARTDLDGKTYQDYSANIEGTKIVLEAANTIDNLKKIIITSSMLVCRAGYKPKHMFDYNPSTIYGESKVQTEKIVWDNQPKCDWAIIRPTSIWGPWFDVPYRNFFDLLIAKKYFHIGNKSATKTYGYVGNAVYQIEKILFSETFNNDDKIFYIGDEKPTNIEEWANEIAENLNYKILKIPYSIIFIAAIFGDVLKSCRISFPMTSFRLKNMTTNNIVDLANTIKLAPHSPFTRENGIKETLLWLSKDKSNEL
jgi:nucleoside-diphosphate-sugar epimerase